MKELKASGEVYVVMQKADYIDLYEQDGNATVVIAVCDTRETAREVFMRTWDAIRATNVPNTVNGYTAEDEIDERALSATRTIYDSFGVTDETHETWVFKSPIVTQHKKGR